MKENKRKIEEENQGSTEILSTKKPRTEQEKAPKAEELSIGDLPVKRTITRKDRRLDSLASCLKEAVHVRQYVLMARDFLLHLIY
ncbi:hypothetical protein NF27_JF00510 [Candidatus Jidaibacter acanthamoeba]|uniref:Uncharacterized protein n=1 Tax=Candidatus Jidaibacter acanthamoebae TaxID=86105 RepID=A0A0C1QIY9_9RICK|nr:hypothetical protein [Candidatus Jidaibacter acanthamoeba]KIE04173.1 hypothetical protein NF27_JF00510 [Candidatus Jidaibacter acanthamoeba]